MNSNSGVGDIALDNQLSKSLKRIIEPYAFEVGILNDGPHYKAQPLKGNPPKSYAGGPARPQSAKIDGTLSEISKEVRKKLGFNYLVAPFQKKSSNLIQFTEWFFKSIFTSGRLTQKRRGENLLQAIVRNPILKQEYGRNSQYWAKVKGFNRYLIDTAQFFQAIEAKIRRDRVQG